MEHRALEIQPKVYGNSLRNRTTQIKAIIKDKIEESFLEKSIKYLNKKESFCFKVSLWKKASHFQEKVLNDKDKEKYFMCYFDLKTDTLQGNKTRLVTDFSFAKSIRNNSVLSILYVVTFASHENNIKIFFGM